MGYYSNKPRQPSLLSKGKKIIALSVTCCILLGGISPSINSLFIGNNDITSAHKDENTSSEYRQTNYDDVYVHASYRWSPRYPDPGETVTFYSTSHASNGHITSQRWEFYDGSKDFGYRTTHKFEKKGKFRVTLHVTAYGYQGGFTWDTRTIKVQVGADPFPRIICTPEDPSPGEEVTLDASKSKDPDGEITSYNWSYYNREDPEKVIYLDSDEVVSHTWTKQGIYIVSLLIQDDKGNTNTFDKEVHVSILKIGSFSTQFRGLSFEIDNHGITAAENLRWSVEIQKYSLVGFKSKQLYQKSGRISSIDADKSKKIQLNDIRRMFTKIELIVTARADNAIEVSKSFYGLTFGKSISLKEQDFVNPYRIVIFSGLTLAFILFMISLFSGYS